MRKRTQKAVDDISPQVQSEMVRPYKSASYQEHEYNQVPEPGIDPWQPIVPEPIPSPIFRLLTPIFIPSAGEYLDTQKISIICSVANAEIHFTRNGGVPDRNSELYSRQIDISDGLMLAARAYLDGWDPSNVATAIYSELSVWSFMLVIDTSGSDEYFYTLLYNSINDSILLGGASRYWGPWTEYNVTAEIFRSTNNGVSFASEKMLAPGPEDNPDLPAGGIWENNFIGFCHNTEADVLLAYSSGLVFVDDVNTDLCSRIWKSTDGGDTWVLSKTFLPSVAFGDDYLIMGMIYDKLNNVFITFIYNDGFYNSSDGITWTKVKADAVATKRIIIYDEIRNVSITYAYPNMEKSADGGTNWTTLCSSFSTLSIAHDITRDIMVCVKIDGDLYVSVNGGSTWTLSDDSFTYVTVKYDSNSKNFYATTDNAKIYKSQHGRSPWTLEKDFYALGYTLSDYLRIEPAPGIGYLFAAVHGTSQDIWRKATTTRALTQPSAPTVSGTTPTTDTTPTWSWTASGNGNYRYKLDDSDLTSGATETTEQSYTPSSPLSLGAHTLYVQARDSDYYWSNSGSFEITVEAAGGGWAAYFDDAHWQVLNPPDEGSWSTDHWVTETVGGSYQSLIIENIGAWATGFRPTKVRITHNSASPIILYVEGDSEVYCYNDSYSSLTEIDLAVSSDVNFVQIQQLGETPFNITNIEFYS